MKKLYFLKSITIFNLLLLCCVWSAGAQGIYQFWGSTYAGGPDDNGVFFSTKYNGTGQHINPYFQQTNAGRPWSFNKPILFMGKLYSILRYGGANDEGIISEFDPLTNVYSNKFNFHDLNTGAAGNALVQGGLKLYGVTESAGNGASTLFEFNPANGGVTVQHEFVTATGTGVAHEPVFYNGKLYGMTSSGGNNNAGVIYEFDPASGTYTVKHHFTQAMGGSSDNGFTIYASKLYSITNNSEMLFSFDPATNVFDPKIAISTTGGSNFYGTLAILNNKLYGIASEGGQNNHGLLFEYSFVANAINAKMQFTNSTPNNRFNLISHNAVLYGASIFGGLNGEGELFSYEPFTNTYNSIQTFNTANGGAGCGSISIYNNKIYGWLLDGGYSSGKGTMFEYSLINNQYQKKITLGADELTHPNGELMYYKHKLYGAAANGGTLNGGGIYSFDLQTNNFAVKVPMAETAGKFSDQGGFVLYNDKFYGVTSTGGNNGKGTVFQYDPNSNTYTVLHHFAGAGGENPFGRLIILNGKMYGTTRGGGVSDRGTIFELNPANNVVTTKVLFDGVRGEHPYATLTVYNGRIFGLAALGGTNDAGTIFEYNAQANGLTKLADFDNTAYSPVGSLLVYDNKLWGITQLGGIDYYAGSLFQFDLATNQLSKKFTLSSTTTGRMAMAGMILHNDKFYGLTNIGASSTDGSVLFEYDPATNNYQVKSSLEASTGKWARRTELAKVPAPTAPGSANSCTNTQTININAANANEWIPFTDAQGRAVAEINANGNILGNTAVRVFVNGGNIRQTGAGLFYLDRNITITPTNQPATPVSIRLYIKKTEFDDLKATAGSGVNIPTDLTIFRNNDFCTPAMTAATTQLVSVKSDWGFDYVYTADVNSFSSFYFASKNNVVLPVKMIYFKGAVQPAANQLEWKTVCTNAVDFIIERSTDGIHFDSIGIKKAQQIDCNAPFTFKDETPVPLGYYRIKMLEDNGSVSYSSIVVLERTGSKLLEVLLMPNPVVGNKASLQITASAPQQLMLSISDANGRTLLNNNLTITAGVNNLVLPLPVMPAGVYYLRFGNDKTRQTIKMLKQ